MLATIAVNDPFAILTALSPFQLLLNSCPEDRPEEPDSQEKVITGWKELNTDDSQMLTNVKILLDAFQECGLTFLSGEVKRPPGISRINNSVEGSAVPQSFRESTRVRGRRKEAERATIILDPQTAGRTSKAPRARLVCEDFF
ncbi:hypothetical protein KM043_002498 [Ampulex compressa]|nr:hypothetical protein KM043_002498 [Ampulex compressa]